MGVEHLEIQQHENFEWVEKGDGPPIILLHGLFGALSNFKDVFDSFSKEYRVIIPLLPIYKLPVIDTGVRSLAKYLQDFIEFKKLENVNLLGNSLGGHVALVYTLKNQEKVRTMTLTGSSGLYENAFGRTYPKRGDYDFVQKKVEVTFYDPKHATKELVDECYRLVNDKGSLLRTLALAKSAIRHNMAKDIVNITVPSCLIWGKNDTITPPEVAEEFLELLPNAELYWIDECGHAPMMEQPEKFNSVYKSWLDKTFANT